MVYEHIYYYYGGVSISILLLFLRRENLESLLVLFVLFVDGWMIFDDATIKPNETTTHISSIEFIRSIPVFKWIDELDISHQQKRERGMKVFLFKILVWSFFALSTAQGRTEADIERYHRFIEKTYAEPHAGVCHKGLRIGYFEVAASVDIPGLKNMSKVTPEPERHKSIPVSIGFQNVWVLQYLGLCKTANFVLQMDEDFSSKYNLCDLAKSGEAQSYAEIRVALSVGFHVIRTLNVLEASTLFPTTQWLSHMQSKWFFYAWDEYHSEVGHNAGEIHYKINPAELYDLAEVQRDLGLRKESKSTRTHAQNILRMKSFYQRDVNEPIGAFQNYSYVDEETIDRNYFATQPQYDRRDCNLDDPNEKFLVARPPMGGLNNQMNEIVQIMAISYAVERTLIMPGLSLDIPVLTKNLVDSQTKFHAIFDFERAQAILKGKLCVVKEGQISEDLEPDYVVVPHGREAPLDLYRREYGPDTTYAKKKILGLRRPTGHSHYLVRFFGPHAKSVERMMSEALHFHPDIRKPAMEIVHKLRALAGDQKKFMAVHHRVESDWREHSNHMERLWGPDAEFWVGPKTIKSRIDSVQELKNTAVVFISVAERNLVTFDGNSNATHLVDLWEKGNVHIAKLVSSFTGDTKHVVYLVLSAISFIVCEHSAVFVGNGYSSFAQEISKRHSTKGKPSYVYNGDRGMQAAKLRTDHGRLSEPFFSTISPNP